MIDIYTQIMKMLFIIFVASLLDGCLSNCIGQSRHCDDCRNLRTYTNEKKSYGTVADIRSKCRQNKENKEWRMVVEWGLPTDSPISYLVEFTIPYDSEYKACFNSSITNFEFKKGNTFQEGKSYEASVRPLPIPSESGTVKVKLGSCPRLGKWGAWSDYGECDCKCDGSICTGKQVQQRECYIYSSKENYTTGKIDCEGNLDSRTRDCQVDCPKGKWGDWENVDDCKCNCSDSNKTQCSGLQARKRKCYSKGKTVATSKCSEDAKYEDIPCNRTCTVDNPRNGEPVTKEKIAYVVGGVSAAILIIVCLYMFVDRDRKLWSRCIHKPIPPEMMMEEGADNVYISYVCEPHDENKMLSLVYYVRGFGLNCIIDLLCTVEINKFGGLPHWIPYKMATADKILVVLTKTYVKALNSAQTILETVPDQVCKAHTEFNLIKTIMYHSCHRTPKLVIVLDGVKKEEIPTVFQGRYYCTFPKKMSDEEDSCKKLIGLLLDTNPIQLGSSKI